MLSKLATIHCVPRKSLFQRSQHRSISAWTKVEKGPEDPILGVTVAYNKETHPKKINLGVGAYRDDQGKPFILNCVKQVMNRTKTNVSFWKAETKIREQNMDHEYAAIGGVPALVKVSQELVLGSDAQELKDKRVSE
jgi:aspartate aminotransferase